MFLGVSKEEVKPAAKTIPSKKQPHAAPGDSLYLQWLRLRQGGPGGGDSQVAFQEQLEEMRLPRGPGRRVEGDTLPDPSPSRARACGGELSTAPRALSPVPCMCL